MNVGTGFDETRNCEGFHSIFSESLSFNNTFHIRIVEKMCASPPPHSVFRVKNLNFTCI